MTMTTDFKVAEVQLSYRNTVPYDKRTKVRDAKDAYKVMLKTHNDDTLDYIETFKVLYLNQNNHVLGCRTISEGGLASTCCDVRTILQGALLTNAVGIILAHNHPSGDVSPSKADISATARLNTALKSIGVYLFDHMIIGNNNFYSFSDNKLISY